MWSKDHPKWPKGNDQEGRPIPKPKKREKSTNLTVQVHPQIMKLHRSVVKTKPTRELARTYHVMNTPPSIGAATSSDVFYEATSEVLSLPWYHQAIIEAKRKRRSPQIRKELSGKHINSLAL